MKTNPAAHQHTKSPAARLLMSQKAIKKHGVGVVSKLPINKPESGSRRSGAVKLPAKTKKKQRLLNKRKGGNAQQAAAVAAMEI